MCGHVRKRKWSVVIASMVAVFLAAFAGVAPAAEKPVYGGTLNIGLDIEFRGFDPLKAHFLGMADRSVINAVEERLFDMDTKGNLVPELGLSAVSSKDGREWTIKLRKGVVFHDGEPFNADAVVLYWDRLLDPKNRFFGLPHLEPIQEVKKVDDYTVRFTLKHPWAPFKQVISSAAGFGAYIPSPKSLRENTLHRAPVGTGPYIFKEWVANDHILVVRNPNYWRKGKPHLDSVMFRPVPDMQARFSGLQAGQSDVILTDRGASIVQAKEDRGLRVYAADAAGAMNWIMNLSKPPLDDARVRRALAHAWNQEFFVKADYKNTLPIAKDPFGGKLSCGDAGYREYDPAKARKLLAEYGKPVTLELLHSNTPRGKEAGEIMQRLFKDVGVTLKLVAVTEGQLFKRVMTGDYEISGWRFMDYDDMGPFLNATLRSDVPGNFSKYRNQQMDELLTAQQTSTDPRVRKKALCGVAKLMNEDALFIYGGGRRFHLLANASVQGLSAEDGIVKVRDLWLKQPGKKVAAR